MISGDGGHQPFGQRPRRWPSRSLLGRLSSGTRQDLLARCRYTTFAAGERLLNQGEHDRQAIVLLRGLVKIQLVDPEGFEVLLAVRRHGDVVGELAALSGDPRTASVVAVNTVDAGVVSGSTFSHFLADHSDAARELILVQGERLTWANHRRADFTARSAESKIANVLADLAADVDDEGIRRVRLGQQDLASIVGIALTTAQGALRSLAAAGLIERHYRTVTIPDLASLVRFAETHQ